MPAKKSFYKNYVEASTSSDDTVIAIKSLVSAQTIPLYGFNANNIRGVSWTDSLLMARIKKLKPQILRYPGGNVANWWNWKTGWFVNHKNLPQKFGSIKDANRVKMDLSELQSLVNVTGSDVLFVLNVLTATLEDQINMLHKAEELGIPVKWVELGNELNLINNPGHIAFRTGGNYGEKCSKWILKIKEEFPDVKIAVVGGNRKDNNHVKTWNRDVLGAIPDVDALVWHSYLAAKHTVELKKGINFELLDRKLKGIFHAEGFKKDIGNKDTEVWVTEYNLQWTILKDENKKQIQKISQTWQNALAVLFITSEITEVSPRVKMVLNHNLTSFPIFAAIETFPNTTYNLLPNGEAMQIWLNTIQQMTLMQKLNFEENECKIEDYEVFGWKFSNDEQGRILIVNITDQNKTIDLNSFYNDNPFKVYYSNVQKTTVNFEDVQIKEGKLKSETMVLPPHAVAIIEI